MILMFAWLAFTMKSNFTICQYIFIHVETFLLTITQDIFYLLSRFKAKSLKAVRSAFFFLS